ncbi:AmpG family muropeptide MFS transporter [Tolypothrix campylonemoides VB511288]|nr:AmpG family muropeptide MFS transporter [Tolypothrix campylonemoides VB511288]
MTSDAGKPAPGWRGVVANLRQPSVLVMLLLGFSSGIPIYLVGNTLGFWMRENGIELSTIGFLSWVGLAYSLKFLWAPLVDKADAPLLGRWLGRRRGWMLLSQLVVAAALVGMAIVEPRTGDMVVAGVALDQLLVFGGLALVVAFASATQDIVIDAWRIETAQNAEQQSLLTSSATLGYRGALLVTDALILIVAAHVGWTLSYQTMGALMGVGVLAVFLAREPARAAAAQAVRAVAGVSDAVAVRWLLGMAVGLAWLAWALVAGLDDAPVAAVEWPLLVLAPLLSGWLLRRPTGPAGEGTWTRPLVRPMVVVRDAVFEPFAAFFRAHGTWALLILLAISLYRLPDFLMGPMANPFYADLGIDKQTVGAVRGTFGLAATVLGVIVAGLSAVRFGFFATLVAGVVLGPGSNLAFAYLALHGADAGVFTAAMMIDNFCNGFASVALIGYMSSLTSVGYTATQYALLSSFYALPGKFLKGLSGVAIERLEAGGRTLLEAYSLFFLGTALLGIPALLLCLLLAARRTRPVPLEVMR